MADISKITVGSTTYNIKDTSGRATASNAAVMSTYLSTSSKTIDNIAFTAGQTITTSAAWTRSGYTPLGIVGLRIEGASSGGIRGEYCHRSRFYQQDDGTVNITLRNYYANGTAKIKVIFYTLWAKTG